MKPLILGLLAALSFSSAASAADCVDVAAKALEQKGITDWERSEGNPTLENIIMTQNITMGYRAWFRVARCESGHVVVNMHTSCTVTDIWAQGECDPEIRQALSK